MLHSATTTINIKIVIVKINQSIPNMSSKDRVKRRLANIISYLVLIVYPLFLLVIALVELIKTLVIHKKCKNIAGDVAVVTGGAHGLGKALSLELASRGCHIAVVDINMNEAEQTVMEIIAKHKVKAKAYRIDVSQHDQVLQLNEQINVDLGIPTILVNNAAVLMLPNPNKPHWEDVQRMINVNLVAHFWTNTIFLPKMKEVGRGHIIAISSASSFFPLIYNSEYTSTKFAVRGLMRVLRQELKLAHYDQINTTTVFPSFLKTNDEVARIIHKSGSDAFFPLISGEEAAKRIVKGMLLNEEEITMPHTLAFLYRCFEFLPSTWQDRLLLSPARFFKQLQKKSLK